MCTVTGWRRFDVDSPPRARGEFAAELVIEVPGRPGERAAADTGPVLVRRGGGGGRGLLVLAAITAVALVTALVSTGSQPSAAPRPAPATAPPSPSKPTRISAPPTSTAGPPPPVPAISGRLVIWRGDQLTSRSLDGTGPSSLIATIKPVGDRPQLLALPGAIFAIGTLEGGDGRTGAWVFASGGAGSANFLGPADKLVPSAVNAPWLVGGDGARPAEAGDISSPHGAVPPGQLVGVKNSSFVTQVGAELLWWTPGSDYSPVPVGQGYALGGGERTLLWSTDLGQLIVSDPRTRWASEPPTARALWGYGSLSPHDVRYVAVSGLHVAFGTVGGPSFEAFLGSPVRSAVWAGDQVLIAVGADGSVTLLDPAHGGRMAAPSIEPGVNAAAFIPT